MWLQAGQARLLDELGSRLGASSGGTELGFLASFDTYLNFFLDKYVHVFAFLIVVFFLCLNHLGTCGLSVTTFFHQVLNYYYLTVYIMFKPKMSLEGSVH